MSKKWTGSGIPLKNNRALKFKPKLQQILKFCLQKLLCFIETDILNVYYFPLFMDISAQNGLKINSARFKF